MPPLHLPHTSQPRWTLLFVFPLGCAQGLFLLSALLLPSSDTRMTHQVERRKLGESGAEWLKGLDRKRSGEDPWPAQEKSWKQTRWSDRRQRLPQQGPSLGSKSGRRSPWSPSEAHNLPSLMCTVAKFRAHPSCQGTLSLQLFLSNGFLLPRYGFGFNNS